MDTMPVIVWTEIPVKNLTAAQEYYSNVLLQKAEMIKEGGSQKIRIYTDEKSVGTDLYEGEVGHSNMALHFFVPGRLEDAMERVKINGGCVEGPAVKIPQGRFAYTRDPDGNRIGLFEVAP